MPILKTVSFNQNSGSPQAIATYDPELAAILGGCEVPTGNIGEYRTNQGGYNTVRDIVNSYNNHQYAITTFRSGAAAGYYSGPAVCCQADGSSYHVDAVAAHFYYSRETAGVPDLSVGPIAFPSTAVDGERLLLEVVTVGADRVLRVYKNTLATPLVFDFIDEYTDVAANNPHFTGSAGFFGYDNAAGSGYGTGAWEGGDYAAAGGGYPEAPAPNRVSNMTYLRM